MEIKNTTLITFEIMKKFSGIHSALFFKSNFKSSIFFIPLMLLFLIGYSITENFIPLIIVAFIAIIFLPLYNKALRSNYKKSPIADKNINYTFKDDVLDMAFDSGSQSSNNSIKYSSLFRVCETPKYFFIYSSELGAHLIDKSGFENPSDAETVASTLKSFIPEKKYIIYKK